MCVGFDPESHRTHNCTFWPPAKLESTFPGPISLLTTAEAAVIRALGGPVRLPRKAYLRSLTDLSRLNH